MITEPEGVKLAIPICYDVEFPETARWLALAGAELVACSTAIMQPYGYVPWKVVPVRACESQIFAAYANRRGRESD